MSNIMAMKDVKNKTSRSGFDLSRRNSFTAKIGEILPIACIEVLPPDRFKISMREFMRTAPVQVASFGRVRQYYDWYFVPYRLIWDKFPAFIAQTDNSYHARSLVAPSDYFENHPYITLKDYASYMQRVGESPSILDNGYDRQYATLRLMEYLGYGKLSSFFSTEEDLALNPFPILAYQKIYQDWFRYAQWEKAAPWTYNLDYINESNQLKLNLASLNPVTGSSTMFDLRSANFDKDYYTGLLPTPQFGDTAIAGPVSGTFRGSALLETIPNLTPDEKTRILASMEYDGGGDINTVLGSILKDGTGQSNGAKVATGLNVTAMRESTLGLSILLLRQAECLQKWKEITLSGSPDYREQMQKHWNVSISPSESYLCTYLGGMSTDIDISEVVNTNITSDNVSEIAGKGISAGNGYIEFNNPTKDYGLLMCVYHSKPLIDWLGDYTLPKLLLKTKATDYAIPEFDSVGMQAVLQGEFLSGASDPFAVAGYAPRYIEYKTAVDEVHGAFQTTLKPWVIPYYLDGSGENKLSYLNFKIPIKILDNMFGVEADSTADTDQFYNTLYMNIKSVRSLSRDGLPY